MAQSIDKRIEKLLEQYEDPAATRQELDELERKIDYLKSLKK